MTIYYLGKFNQIKNILTDGNLSKAILMEKIREWKDRILSKLSDLFSNTTANTFAIMLAGPLSKHLGFS